MCLLSLFVARSPRRSRDKFSPNRRLTIRGSVLRLPVADVGSVCRFRRGAGQIVRDAFLRGAKMERVRLGVIGCGVIGSCHARYAKQSDRIELVALADLIEEPVRKLAEEHSVPKVYADAESLLADPDVDAVVLAMPTCARTALALKAFASGKHVLTEKPVAMDAGEVEQMIAARGDLVAACCSSRYQFPASAKAITDFIATGALGELRILRVRQLCAAGPRPEKPGPIWRIKRSLNGGGFLVNWGPYSLDYMLGLAGWSLKPRQVLAQTWPIAPQLESYIAPESDAETHFVAHIRCEGGIVFTIECGESLTGPAENAWQILGARGSLSLNMLPEESKSVCFNYVTQEEGLVSKVIWEGSEDNDVVHAGPVQDFASAILDGCPPKTTLEQSLVIQKITDAIYASAEQDRAVDIR